MAHTVKHIALLGLVLAVIAAVGGQVASRQFGSGAYLASAIAAAIVGLSGSLSLCVVASAATAAGRVPAILLAMLIRLALPLAAMAYFTASQHALLQDGVAQLLVAYYLAGLALETWMSVRFVNCTVPSAGRTGGARDLA